MDAPDNLYSRFVGLAKVLLPLAALGLLSTLFLFSRGGGGETIPMADIEEIAREPRISGPSFAGIADDGSVLSISADTIRPLEGNPDGFVITAPKAEIGATDGSRVEITAGNGRIDGRSRQAELTGLARVTTSSGYKMETSGMTADMRTGVLESTGPLEVRAPFGDLTAGRFTLSDPGDGGGPRMLFTDGVRLLYRPDAEGVPE